MAGLMSGGAAMPPRQEMPEGQGGETATPEEQQQYEQLFKNGWRLIADEQGKPRPGILQMLDSDPSDVAKQLGPEAMQEAGDQFDPATALGATVAVICLRLASSLKQAGQQILPAAMFEAGKDLLSDLAELGEKNGLGPYDDAAMSRAAAVAAGMYGKAAKDQGLISEQDVQQDVSDMQQADQSGQLQQMLGGAKAQAAAQGADTNQGGDTQTDSGGV